MLPSRLAQNIYGKSGRVVPVLSRCLLWEPGIFNPTSEADNPRRNHSWVLQHSVIIMTAEVQKTTKKIRPSGSFVDKASEPSFTDSRSKEAPMWKGSSNGSHSWELGFLGWGSKSKSIVLDDAASATSMTPPALFFWHCDESAFHWLNPMQLRSCRPQFKQRCCQTLWTFGWITK